MHKYHATLVPGLVMALCSSSFAIQQDPAPVQPVAPIAPSVSAPPAPSSASSSKTGNASKKHSHADDFLILGTVFSSQALALPGAELRIRRAGENKYRWKTVTNSRGDFAVRVPQGASYEVLAGGKGFAARTLTVDAVHTGDTQQRISIRLEPATGGTK
jgi:carboxypeptidase family protein